MANQNFDVICKVIAEKMDIDAAGITMESSLSELEIDSLDMVEIIMSIEEELGISLEELTDVKTVGDVMSFIEAQG